jgi:hypothetical protein
MKTGEEAVYLLIDRMNEIGVDYMIVGSFSSNAYGLARATKDADFVIQTTEEKRRALMQSLPSDFIVDDQITFETVTGHLRQILKLPKIPYMIELFDLSDEPFDQKRFSRRKETMFGGRRAWLPAPEDVVIQKLRWASLAKRPQDLIDASNVIRVSGEFLDWPYIGKWCAELDILAALAEARKIAEG